MNYPFWTYSHLTLPDRTDTALPDRTDTAIYKGWTQGIAAVTDWLSTCSDPEYGHFCIYKTRLNNKYLMEFSAKIRKHPFLKCKTLFEIVKNISRKRFNKACHNKWSSCCFNLAFEKGTSSNCSVFACCQVQTVPQNSRYKIKSGVKRGVIKFYKASKLLRIFLKNVPHKQTRKYRE